MSELPSSAATPSLADFAQAQARIEQLEQALQLAHQAKKVADERMAYYANYLTEGVVLLNAEGKVLLLNKPFCEFFGVSDSAGQWLQRPVAELSAAIGLCCDQSQQLVREFEAVVQSGQPSYGKQVHLTNGRILDRDVVPLQALEVGSTNVLLRYRDITSQHQAAAELQAMSRIPEQNPNPVLRFRKNGELLFANAALRGLRDSLDADSLALVWQSLLDAATQALATNAPQTLEIAFGPRLFRVKVMPFAAEEYTNLYLQEITEQREVELQMANQRQFYETILDELPVEVVMLDAEQRYLYANPYAVPNAEARTWLLGHTITEFCQRYQYPLTLAEQRVRMFEEAQQDEQLVIWDDITPHPDGVRCHQRHYKAIAGPDGALQFMLGYGLDITDRVKAQQQLLDEQKFTQQVLDTIPSLIYVRDAAGNLVFRNHAMRQLQEFRPYRAKAAQDANSIVAREEREYTAADAHVLATGEEIKKEDPYTLPSGEVLWFQTIKRPLRRPDGAMEVLGVSTDITDLKAATEAAEAAAKARENFLANMSHEIRTPLNGVLGMAGQLAKTNLNERQQELLKVIRSSGQHLLGILNDVLDMAKITSGKLEFEQTAFNLCDSMGQAVEPLALLATEKGLEFKGTPLRESCPNSWVVGDPFRLNQILINLVSNAVKFTERGTISVGGYYVGETETHLTTEFRVTDTGIGIAPDKIDRIFEGFTQAYADTTRRFGGTGLGLSISRVLVEKLGGLLKVESEVGRGSTFSFTLTLPKAEAPRAKKEDVVDNGSLAGRRILLAEDNEINRDVARLMLEEWQVQVDEAPDGLVAVEMHAANAYDVILMDIQMPNMNGLEATARIRQHPNAVRAQVPILALTANAFRADNELYLAAGMNDCLAKPFEEDALYQKLVDLVASAAQTARSYDLTSLRELARGKQTFVDKIIRSFLRNIPETVQELRLAAGDSNWTRVAELVHHIKPNLVQLGVEGVDEAVKQLEQARHPGSSETRLAAIAHLTTRLDRVVQELPSELSSEEA
ncbi:ATP-binding protein [Hymenobacter cellulosivorans]|uniref:histidine kinase n=1 Tax=Hymenobacter cellulosivorans TaxID=2932249 RepID=A0ABY4FAT3_9BACT|nr:ATP-binding protein [Hymenobacter cellulosivorans]UOQ53118.1 ATP-binding protein [Hymenobacter cellulosivorans]